MTPQIRNPFGNNDTDSAPPPTSRYAQMRDTLCAETQALLSRDFVDTLSFQEFLPSLHSLRTLFQDTLAQGVEESALKKSTAKKTLARVHQAFSALQAASSEFPAAFADVLELRSAQAQTQARIEPLWREGLRQILLKEASSPSPSFGTPSPSSSLGSRHPPSQGHTAAPTQGSTENTELFYGLQDALEQAMQTSAALTHTLIEQTEILITQEPSKPDTRGFNLLNIAQLLRHFDRFRTVVQYYFDAPRLAWDRSLVSEYLADKKQGLYLTQRLFDICTEALPPTPDAEHTRTEVSRIYREHVARRVCIDSAVLNGKMYSAAPVLEKEVSAVVCEGWLIPDTPDLFLYAARTDTPPGPPLPPRSCSMPPAFPFYAALAPEQQHVFCTLAARHAEILAVLLKIAQYQSTSQETPLHAISDLSPETTLAEIQRRAKSACLPLHNARAQPPLLSIDKGALLEPAEIAAWVGGALGADPGVSTAVSQLPGFFALEDADAAGAPCARQAEDPWYACFAQSTDTVFDSEAVQTLGRALEGMGRVMACAVGIALGLSTPGVFDFYPRMLPNVHALALERSRNLAVGAPALVMRELCRTKLYRHAPSAPLLAGIYTTAAMVQRLYFYTPTEKSHGQSLPNVPLAHFFLCPGAVKQIIAWLAACAEETTWPLSCMRKLVPSAPVAKCSTAFRSLIAFFSETDPSPAHWIQSVHVSARDIDKAFWSAVHAQSSFPASPKHVFFWGYSLHAVVIKLFFLLPLPVPEKFLQHFETAVKEIAQALTQLKTKARKTCDTVDALETRCVKKGLQVLQAECEKLADKPLEGGSLASASLAGTSLAGTSLAGTSFSSVTNSSSFWGSPACKYLVVFIMILILVICLLSSLFVTFLRR